MAERKVRRRCQIVWFNNDNGNKKKVAKVTHFASGPVKFIMAGKIIKLGDFFCFYAGRTWKQKQRDYLMDRSSWHVAWPAIIAVVIIQMGTNGGRNALHYTHKWNRNERRTHHISGEQKKGKTILFFEQIIPLVGSLAHLLPKAALALKRDTQKLHISPPNSSLFII